MNVRDEKVLVTWNLVMASKTVDKKFTEKYYDQSIRKYSNSSFMISFEGGLELKQETSFLVEFLMELDAVLAVP